MSNCIKNLENLEVSKWAGIVYRWAGIVEWTVCQKLEFLNQGIPANHETRLRAVSVRKVAANSSFFICALDDETFTGNDPIINAGGKVFPFMIDVMGTTDINVLRVPAGMNEAPASASMSDCANPPTVVTKPQTEFTIAGSVVALASNKARLHVVTLVNFWMCIMNPFVVPTGLKGRLNRITTICIGAFHD